MLTTQVPMADVLRLVVATLDARDPYTFEHSRRVASLAEMTAAALGLSAESQSRVAIAAHLHDIGKVAVADSILKKTGVLTPREFAEVQAHPRVGHDILASVAPFRELTGIVLHHHERWDGRGYPDGLIGPDIPLEARIIALADAFDAVTSDRPYRRRLSFEQGLEEVRRQSGSQFCPDCVCAFFATRHQLKVRLYESNRSLLSGRLATGQTAGLFGLFAAG